MSARTDASAAGRTTRTDVLIVGTGFSGLGMAIQLRKAGRHDFVVVEKAHEVGGTWRDNTYPGCACDIPSHMYSFSFHQNPDWARSYSPQPEIYAYLRRVADDYDLRRSIRFGVEVESARWDAAAQRWTGDRRLRGGVQLPGAGQRHRRPAHPAHPRARGRCALHRAGVPLGAVAPRLRPHRQAGRGRRHRRERDPVRPRDRSAGGGGAGLPAHRPWVLPKPDRAISERTRTAFRRVPGLQRAYRDLLYWSWSRVPSPSTVIRACCRWPRR
jgi:hypothetical protein